MHPETKKHKLITSTFENVFFRKKQTTNGEVYIRWQNSCLIKI